MLDVAVWLAAVAVSYLVGALPSGLIVGRVLRGVDIRNYGSGATGATNVYRTLGRVPAALVLIIDFLKGALPVLATRIVASVLDVGAPNLLEAVAGIVVIAGHTWPIYVGFKGGKGIATGVGALTVISPIAAAVALISLPIIAATRYVSLGALIGAGVSIPATAALAIFWGWPFEHILFTVVGCAMILFRHSSNINRLLDGTERRVEANPKPERAAESQRNTGGN